MKASTKVLLGIAAGMAAGLGLYALSQTEQGKQILKKAKDEADGLAQKAKDLMDKARREAKLDETEEAIS